jgi:hypothetical protein
MMTRHFTIRFLATALLLAGAGLALGASDANAQLRRGGFFEQLFGGGGGGGGYSRQPSQQLPFEPQERSQADYTRAPPAKKPETPPTSIVMVLGDSMSDWLAYGLEDTLSDVPEIGVVRKSKTYSGLIRYDTKSDQDWPRVARELLTQEKADVVVMMLGLNDRISIRDVPAPKKKTSDPKGKDARSKDAVKDGASKDDTKDPKDQKTAEQEKADDESDQLTIIAPEPGRNGGSDEFRSDRWAELYSKKVDDMIAALKSRGVPVIWVGLPSIRGARSTADAQYLNELYRARAQKAGIVYVDVWDGFVDEAGRYTLHGPDVEGQTRRLRAYDGVHFTSYGAQKLAHYVDREIRRLMNSRASPVALPSGTPGPDVAAPSGPAGPSSRPLAGPVMPLGGTASASDELLGAGRVASGNDATASRVLVKGEPVAAPAGRADDFAWPRGDAAANANAAVPTNAEVTPAKPQPQAGGKNAPNRQTAQTGAGGQIRTTPGFIQPQRQAPPPQRPEPPRGGGLFGLFR